MGTFWNGHKKGACLRVKLPICLWIKVGWKKNGKFQRVRNGIPQNPSTIISILQWYCIFFKRIWISMSWKRADLKPEYSTSMNLGRIQQSKYTHMWLHYKLQRWNLAYSGKTTLYSYSRQSKYEKPTWMLVIVLVVLNLASGKGV